MLRNGLLCPGIQAPDFQENWKRSIDLKGVMPFDDPTKPYLMNEYFKIYTFFSEVIHPMVITALRCGLSARFLEQLGTLKTVRRRNDPNFTQRETTAAISERLEFDHFSVRSTSDEEDIRSLPVQLYYQRPDNEDTANYKFIDISPAIIDEKRSAPRELLIACRFYGIPTGQIQNDKMDKFDANVKDGREVPALGGYMGFVTNNYMRSLKDG